MKARFEGELITLYLDEPVDKTKWFELYRSFGYRAENGELYLIPAGIATDFASIPRPFRWLISRFGRHGKAAVLHDWLCKFKIVSRKKTDMLLREAMKVLEVSWWKRQTMYAGVRFYSIVTFKSKNDNR